MVSTFLIYLPLIVLKKHLISLCLLGQKKR